MKQFVTQINVLIQADVDYEAASVISEVLEAATNIPDYVRVLEWSYAGRGSGGWMHPVEIVNPYTQEELDGWAVLARPLQEELERAVAADALGKENTD